jgi:DNA-binding transcriptional LysR family regulator
LLADAEVAESALLAPSATPGGTASVAAPMSPGILEVAPDLCGFPGAYPHISIGLHLGDALVDVIGDGSMLP